ncbi:hypothetical protein FW774_16070 [Pedobacter sp. BS3]|uniref:hypothetical protein n=1 Tax=Pedobacter sp. BS3 TaxID=2567937 RepID=UPI0011EE333D|nr:hypothetical protein [Pedobacter sp. BS3]TZF82205.1 hypothetical protein FW774_16070 [Pedobacter sp. BS3]
MSVDFVTKREIHTVLVSHILRQAWRISGYIIFCIGDALSNPAPTEDVLLNPKEELTREYVKGYIS